MSSAKQKYEFSLKNEVNRLLNTKTIDELVFQLVTERKDHKQQVRRLKEKLNRRQITSEDHVEWSKGMVTKFQRVLDHERKTLQQEKLGQAAAMQLVRKVNEQLESDNLLLSERIKILEKQMRLLESKRLVDSVLLENGVLKTLMDDKKRRTQAESDMKIVALNKAFASGHRYKKRLHNNSKQKKYKPSLSPIRNYRPDTRESVRTTITKEQLTREKILLNEID
tara:strand:+ start:211 stop:882 length:672 start_codon:yes stop_codon:yes gene_type:complete